jgi:hypothetical protein
VTLGKQRWLPLSSSFRTCKQNTSNSGCICINTVSRYMSPMWFPLKVLKSKSCRPCAFNLSYFNSKLNEDIVARKYTWEMSKSREWVKLLQDIMSLWRTKESKSYAATWLNKYGWVSLSWVWQWSHFHYNFTALLSLASVSFFVHTPKTGAPQQTVIQLLNTL